MSIEQWANELKNYLLERYNKGTPAEKDTIMSLLSGVQHCIDIFDKYETLRMALTNFMQGSKL